VRLVFADVLALNDSIQEAKPGRVVTLLPAHDNQSTEKTFGMVYLVAADDKDAVLAYLDVREQVRLLVDHCLPQ